MAYHPRLTINKHCVNSPGPIMAHQDPKPFQNLRIQTLTVAAIVIYFGAGYPLVNKIWPDSDAGLWVLILVGMVGGYLFKKRRRQKDRNL